MSIIKKGNGFSRRRRIVKKEGKVKVGIVTLYGCFLFCVCERIIKDGKSETIDSIGW